MYPPIEAARELAASGRYRSIPVSRELYADSTTPIQVLRRLKYVSDHCFLLESAESRDARGRYTFLGYEPRMRLSCTDGKLTVSAGADVTVDVAHPGEAIRQVIADNASPRLEGMPPFSGGLVGYFSYEYLKYAEPGLVFTAEDTEGFCDVDLMLFDRVIVFDHHRHKIQLIVNVPVDGLESGYRRAERELAGMRELVLEGREHPDGSGRLASPVRELFDEDAYCAMVRRVQEHILEGDIFQAVLSNRLDAGFEGSLLDTYRVLRCLNPSPYMFYFSGDLEIAGASPETLVRVQDGTLHTFPLAGTRPRGGTDEEDAALEQDLLADEKELAEHNMLVDLGRNDLGKVSRFGSVQVERFHVIERFSHVMHIGSTVRGELREGCDAVDAIDAVLPAGTLSGAPKIRACQIIDELEGDKRGIYGGAVGYLDFAGNMDVCIAIRLAYRKGNRVFVRSGAGIVADSVPEREYRECIDKAGAVMQALEMAQGGLDDDSSDR